MVRWKVWKDRYPVDPSKAWIASPGWLMMRAHRFATWREAQDFVAGKHSRRLKDRL